MTWQIAALRRWWLWVLVLAGGVLVDLGPVAAQSGWEVTPYNTHVWVATGNQPDLPQSWKQQIPTELRDKLKGVFRATWDETVAVPPSSVLRSKMLSTFDRITVDDIVAVAPEVKQWDKLFLVRITGQRRGYEILVREFDCSTLRFGPIESGHTDLLPLVSRITVQLITRAFSSVLQIDRTVDNRARMRLRAGALIRSGDAPAAVRPGDVLLPFERRATASGSTGEVNTIDWTYIRVDEQVSGQAFGEVVTGFGQPFRAKKSRRVQQLGVHARPTSKQSVIRLQSRADPPAPLVGYEIYERLAPGKTELIGHTDWQGKFVLLANRQPVRTLFIRSGDRTVKLPVVPGLKDEIVASWSDDSSRLATEGFLAGVQNAMIDLVARRESLTAQIRRRIEAKDFDEAEKLIEKFRNLPSQSDFQSDIAQKQQMLDLSDARVRKRVDTLFVDTYAILGKYLDSSRLKTLTDELAAARR